MVIPALNPGVGLVRLVHDLVARGLTHIVVVDDGSSQEHKETLDSVAEVAGVEVVRHERNLGKGAALKSGIRHIRANHAGRHSLITVDADGQHLPDDVETIARTLAQTPGGPALVLGVRRFDVTVPWRSRFGNWLTRILFRLFTGASVSDTQTGLRGIPADHADELLNIPFARYEFELEALLQAVRTRQIVQVPIRTVYLDGNATSHFRPIVDSLRVYSVFLRLTLVFLRFSVVGALSLALDLMLFWLLVERDIGVATAVVAARIGSGAFNFTANKLGVFGSRGWRHLPRELAAYLVLFVAIMTLSAVMTTFAVVHLALPPLVAKVSADSVLFLCAFYVQRRWIFRDARSLRPAAAPQA